MMRRFSLPLLALCAVLACAGARADDTTRVHVADGELHYAGPVAAAANRQLFALYDSLERKPATLVITSKGGEVSAGLELGEWLHARRLAVRVPEYCLSACANYVFTAGARRIVGSSAMVGFHGGVSSTEFKLDDATQAMFDALPKEQQAAFWDKFRQDMQPLVAREAAFFRQVGVDRAITTYGQAPRFAHTAGDGWTYTRQGFARFGVRDIDVAGGPWRPALAGGAAFATIVVD